jgi:U2 small nuclear ribonucleoprotein B''
VIFNDEDAAEAAVQAMRGYMFFGKPMRVNYAKKESDVTKKMRGTFEESEKTKREQKRVQELSKADYPSLLSCLTFYRDQVYKVEEEAY